MNGLPFYRPCLQGHVKWSLQVPKGEEGTQGGHENVVSLGESDLEQLLEARLYRLVQLALETAFRNKSAVGLNFMVSVWPGEVRDVRKEVENGTQATAEGQG